ncbi:hypothetical protein [Phaeacidiphilus oryzae]|uniref:hypothetical protein n=1 Tax=Phaeacidiphilus oryzae TaxID=348818 RepID=UPI00056785E9|nr:hypothetical protein [Phaeacidiphilus oryzae]
MRFVGRLEGAEFERRLREQAEEDLRVVAEAGFPVFGLREGSLPSGERALGGWARSAGRIVKVGLEHGDWGGTGAWVRVESAVDDPGGCGLDELVAEGAGVCAGFEARVVVDGLALAFDGRRRGEVWAMRLRAEPDAPPQLTAGQEPLLLTVVGRGVAVDVVELETVRDLLPYAVGRLRAVEAEAGRAAEWVTEGEAEGEGAAAGAAVGVDAHRELVERAVRHALEAGRRAAAGQQPGGASAPEGQARLWELTIRQQMRLAGESREEAEEAVTALVNQMIRLGECVDWFPGGAEGATALEESLRWAVFGSEVRSAEAQRAWGRVWDWQWGRGWAPGRAPRRRGCGWPSGSGGGRAGRSGARARGAACGARAGWVGCRGVGAERVVQVGRRS